MHDYIINIRQIRQTIIIFENSYLKNLQIFKNAWRNDILDIYYLINKL